MSAHGLDDELRRVEPGQWLDALRQARDEGFVWFDAISAADELGRSDDFRIVARLADPDATPPRGLQVHTLVPRNDAHLPSATGVFPGAGWHEREVHDFFGVVFDGGSTAPLLNHAPGSHPLRKDSVLGARSARAWPGAKEPGEGEQGAAPSRRRMAPPGVPDPAVWGDRDAGAAAPTSEEVAASVAGGRVRRRR